MQSTGLFGSPTIENVQNLNYQYLGAVIQYLMWSNFQKRLAW